MKTGLAQDAGDFRTPVTLNLDPPFLDRAAGAAGLLHRLGQFLLFRQTDANETCGHCHGLAAAMGGLPQDIHPAPMLAGRERCRRLATRLAGPNLSRGRQPLIAQTSEWALAKALRAINPNRFL